MRLEKTKARERAAAKRSKRKQELIEIVKRSSLECGKALMELRDDEYWKDTHTSFREFCEQTFDISGSYLYQLIQGHQIRDSLPEPLQKTIHTEKEARAISKLTVEDRKKAVERYAKLGGNSAPLLREIAEDYTPINGSEKSARADSGLSEKPEAKPSSKSKSTPLSHPEPIRDWEKNIVPQEALSFWQRRNDFWKHRRGLDDLVEHFEKILIPGDFVRAKLPDDLLERIKKVISDLMLIEFYCVCPKCKGEPSTKPEGCSFCCHTGVISKIEFDKLNAPV